MTIDDWVRVIVTILSGMAAVIPVLYELIKYIRRAAMEKNWQALIDFILSAMEDAETLFEKGVDKKNFVLTRVKASQDIFNYEFDTQQISDLIDQLCDMSKKVNSPTSES